MANSIAIYTDEQIMKALITHNFSGINGEFIDDVIMAVKPGAFYQAKNLTKVSLSSATKVGNSAFMETSLTSVELPWNGITSIGAQAFYKGWQGLPSTLTLSNVTELGQGAFAGTTSAKNTKITSVSLPKWTGTTPATNGFPSGSAGIFDYCSNLASVSLPELVTAPNMLFRSCASLEELILPKLKSIGSSMLNGCTSLKKVDFGGEITAINNSFLTNASALETLILRGVTTVPTIGSSVLSSTRISSGNAYVYVPKSLEALFKVASNWSTYSSQIRAIEDYPDVCGS